MLIWNLSVTTTFKDNSWTFFEAVKDEAGFRETGTFIPDPIFNDLTGVLKIPKSYVRRDDVSDVVFRFSIILAESDNNVIICGDNDKIEFISCDGTCGIKCTDIAADGADLLKIFGDIVGGEPKFYSISDNNSAYIPNDYGLYLINHLSSLPDYTPDSVNIELIKELGSGEINNNSVEAITIDRSNNLFYFIDNVEGEELVKTYNPSTEEVKTITLSGDAVSDYTTEYSIGDGGNDMYDGGNILITDVAQANSNDQISYTHNPSTPDIIVNSDNIFGNGSSYVTNMYNGMFVMMAKNISINSFGITGSLGADGDGTVESNELNITVNGSNFGVFTKRIYGTQDPSVNHIIIVPGNIAGVTHTVPPGTDNDIDTISGISDRNTVYYLLFSTTDGNKVSDADFLNIANTFLNIMTPDTTLPNLVTRMRSRYSEITGVISSRHIIEDDAFSAGGGFDGIRGIVFDDSTNDLYVVGENGLFHMNKTGFATLLNHGAIWDDASFMTIHREKLMIVIDREFIAIVNKNGDIENYIDKKEKQVTLFGTGVDKIMGIASINNILYGIVEQYDEQYDTDFNFLVEIDEETLVATIVKRISNETEFRGLTCTYA